jgi:hypothetical protein
MSSVAHACRRPSHHIAWSVALRRAPLVAKVGSFVKDEKRKAIIPPNSQSPPRRE